MISKDMYSVLKQIPRSPNAITLQELSARHIVNVSLLHDIIEDSCSCHYLGPDNAMRDIYHARLYLTEAGQIELEEYEHVEENRKIANESLRIAAESLETAKVAKYISIGSVIVAILALLFQIS